MTRTTSIALNKAFPDYDRIMVQVLYVTHYGVLDALENSFVTRHIQYAVCDYKRFGGNAAFDLFFELADMLGAQ